MKSPLFFLFFGPSNKYCYSLEKIKKLTGMGFKDCLSPLLNEKDPMELKKMKSTGYVLGRF